MGHAAELVDQGLVEPRMAVAVHVAPQTAGAIDVAFAIGVVERGPLPSFDEQRIVLLHLRERMPYVAGIPRSKVVVFHIIAPWPGSFRGTLYGTHLG